MNGVFAAVLTPMKADLSPDHGALVRAYPQKDQSWLNIRPPLTSLAEDQAQALFKALDGIGFAPPPEPEQTL